MISPRQASASVTLSAVFPAAVGPTTTTNGINSPLSSVGAVKGIPRPRRNSDRALPRCRRRRFRRRSRPRAPARSTERRTNKRGPCARFASVSGVSPSLQAAQGAAHPHHRSAWSAPRRRRASGRRAPRCRSHLRASASCERRESSRSPRDMLRPNLRRGVLSRASRICRACGRGHRSAEGRTTRSQFDRRSSRQFRFPSAGCPARESSFRRRLG